MIAPEHPQVVQQIAQEIQKQCSGQTAAKVAVLLHTETAKNVGKVKCIVESISETVKGTDFSKGWEEYKRQVAEKFEQVKACKSKGSIFEVVQ